MPNMGPPITLNPNDDYMKEYHMTVYVVALSKGARPRPRRRRSSSPHWRDEGDACLRSTLTNKAT